MGVGVGVGGEAGFTLWLHNKFLLFLERFSFFMNLTNLNQVLHFI